MMRQDIMTSFSYLPILMKKTFKIFRIILAKKDFFLRLLIILAKKKKTSKTSCITSIEKYFGTFRVISPLLLNVLFRWKRLKGRLKGGEAFIVIKIGVV